MVWNVSANDHIMGTSENKTILKDHDHTVECIAWAPEASFSAVCESAGTDVSQLKTCNTVA